MKNKIVNTIQIKSLQVAINPFALQDLFILNILIFYDIIKKIELSTQDSSCPPQKEYLQHTENYLCNKNSPTSHRVLERQNWKGVSTLSAQSTLSFSRWKNWSFKKGRHFLTGRLTTGRVKHKALQFSLLFSIHRLIKLYHVHMATYVQLIINFSFYLLDLQKFKLL